MTDSGLTPAIREALRQNEIGDASPYQLSYARLGASGASFGIFQADTNVDEDARVTLRAALDADGASKTVAGRIVDAVSKPCPDGSPLTLQDQRTADKALSSAAGRAKVDAMDARTLAIILDELDEATEAAAAHRLSIEPEAQLCIALWVNMTGAPTSLKRWLGGAAVSGVAPPAGPAVRRAEVMEYLRATRYFQLHPRNLVHFDESVSAGARLLPQGLVAAAAQPGIAAAVPAGFPGRVVDLAKAEWQRFGGQTYDLRGRATTIGHKEGEESFFERVGEYWLVGTNVHGLDGRDHGVPWSAAFISFVMRESGAGDRFRYSTQHSVYISQAIRDFVNKREAAGFWGCRLSEVKPRVGDLVCWARQAGIDYDDQNGGDYKGHSDIVVEIQDGQVLVIGGNVGDSVTQRPLALDDEGFLVPSQQGGETLFAIMQDRLG